MGQDLLVGQVAAEGVAELPGEKIAPEAAFAVRSRPQVALEVPCEAGERLAGGRGGLLETGLQGGDRGVGGCGRGLGQGVVRERADPGQLPESRLQVQLRDGPSVDSAELAFGGG